MDVIRSEAELREILEPARREGRTIGFVPTMGALHAGHLSLVQAAKERTDLVVLSIFVNPLQFGPGEDLSRYPRDEQRDLDLSRAEGVDVAFLPSVEEMYPRDRSTVVSVGGVSEPLEGASRPGHFDGVATVVAKLFNQVRPDVVFFGQKDAQQLAVIRRMVRDLAFPVEVIAHPTVREPDGLALSSRNAYLGPDDRKKAVVISQALEAGRAALDHGSGTEGAEAAMAELLRSIDGIEVDYARAVDPDTFEHPAPDRDVLLAVAARVGPARLIDNVVYRRAAGGSRDAG
ncbi:MAG: pantoate--beta-alanine ligase [Actinomycetota bacterium]|nr:pantoate--beta-alanine ligase [Actinomycetota bacterium]